MQIVPCGNTTAIHPVNLSKMIVMLSIFSLIITSTSNSISSVYSHDSSFRNLVFLFLFVLYFSFSFFVAMLHPFYYLFCAFYLLHYHPLLYLFCDSSSFLFSLIFFASRHDLSYQLQYWIIDRQTHRETDSTRTYH